GHIWVSGLFSTAQGNLLALAEITEVEIIAALQQLARSRTLKRRRVETAITLFWDQVDQGQYTAMPITSAIVREAAALCARHPLKGYDAVQLACALAFRQDVRASSAVLTGATPPDPISLSEDHRLTAAAQAEGFAVDTPLAHP
ncbi:MAG: type II toxin-antitoxin system VapC family toxin, partial [Ktedonobacterales bacterium]